MGALKLTYYDRQRDLEVNSNFSLRVVEKNAPREKNRVSSSTYGFNGHEKDLDLNSEGNTLDFGARIYDGRIAKFLSIDPWEGKYAWQTPYAYFANSPISQIDWNGFGDPEDDKNSKETVDKRTSGGLILDKNIAEVTKLKGYVSDFKSALDYGTFVAGYTDDAVDYIADFVKFIGKNSHKLNNMKDPGGSWKKIVTSASVFGAYMSMVQMTYDSHNNKAPSMGTMVSASGALSKSGRVNFITLAVSIMLEIHAAKLQSDINEVEFGVAQQGWEYMRNFVSEHNFDDAGDFNLKNGKTIVFVYAAQDVHEQYMFETIPIMHAFKNADEAEKNLGFKPTVVYWGFLEDFKVDVDRGWTEWIRQNKLKID